MFHDYYVHGEWTKTRDSVQQNSKFNTAVSVFPYRETIQLQCLPPTPILTTFTAQELTTAMCNSHKCVRSRGFFFFLVCGSLGKKALFGSWACSPCVCQFWFNCQEFRCGFSVASICPIDVAYVGDGCAPATGDP